MRYKEQFQRIKRWYKRFSELNEGRIHDRDSDYYKDDVYAFFLNCHNLKDWLIGDDSIKIKDKKKTIEEYVTANKALSVAADICNSLKHLVLKSSRTGDTPTFVGNDIKLELGLSTLPKTSMVFWVSLGTEKINAFDIATDCIKAWDDFFKRHGI